MSFYIGGTLDITKINRDTFIRAANEVGIGEKLAMKNFDHLLDQIEICMDDAAEELFQMGYKDVFLVRDSIKEQIYKSLCTDA